MRIVSSEPGTLPITESPLDNARTILATPAALGYRMPAEWEPHEATWIAWPHNRSDWPGKFETHPWIYAEIVRHLTRVERVNILVDDEAAEAKARAVLVRAHVLPEKASAPGKPAGNRSLLPNPNQPRVDARLRPDSFVASTASFAQERLPCRRGDRVAIQCLGQIQRLETRRAGRRRNRQTPASSGMAAGSQGRRRTAPHRAGGRQHRRQRPRHADHHRRVSAERYSAAQPWRFARAYWRNFSPTILASRK